MIKKTTATKTTKATTKATKDKAAPKAKASMGTRCAFSPSGRARAWR